MDREEVEADILDLKRTLSTISDYTDKASIRILCSAGFERALRLETQNKQLLSQIEYKQQELTKCKDELLSMCHAFRAINKLKSNRDVRLKCFEGRVEDIINRLST